MLEQKIDTMLKHLYKIGLISPFLALLCIAIIFLGNFSAPDLIFSILMGMTFIFLGATIISLGTITILVILYSLKARSTTYLIKYLYPCFLFILFIFEMLKEFIK